jgi:Tfp pilus assembly protein PilV
MRSRSKYRGFSLTEVLLAVATLAVGMVFISGTFLTGIHFSTIATERSIASVVADEAFAKIRIYGIDFTDPNLAIDRQTRFDYVSFIPPVEFEYPSTDISTDKQYCWSALCRPVYSGPTNRFVQVTVFICRKLGYTTMYQGGTGWPIPIQVGVEESVDPDDPTPVKNFLGIIERLPDASGDITLINDGSVIADDNTGRLYRVLKRYEAPNDSVIELDRNWDDTDQYGNSGLNPPYSVWVIPPPVGGGKNPCIAVYQELIGF